MAYWLVKSEPDVYSIDDFKRDRVTTWDKVRNYQARNFLRNMQVREEVLFYHSSTDPSGVSGLARVKKLAYADPSQFDKAGDYFDSKATPKEPRWFCPDIEFVRKFKKLITLDELRAESKLKNMLLLKRGSRLSVQPVSQAEFEKIMELAE